MPADLAVAPPPPASPRSFVRVEYLDFESVPDQREYRLAVCRPEGPRRLVTSLLELEVLSAPHTWETGPRGKNRPRETAPWRADVIR